MIKGVINNKNIQSALSKFSHTFCYLRVKPNLTENFFTTLYICLLEKNNLHKFRIFAQILQNIICTNFALFRINAKKKKRVGIKLVCSCMDFKANIVKRRIKKSSSSFTKLIKMVMF